MLSNDREIILLLNTCHTILTRLYLKNFDYVLMIQVLPSLEYLVLLTFLEIRYLSFVLFSQHLSLIKHN